MDDITIGQLVEAELKARGVRQEAFQQIVGRLFGLSILHREDSAIERQLYDDAVRIEGLLNAYFDLGGFRLLHERHQSYFRLYPPGARVPGLPAEDDAVVVDAVRARLSADFVACCLVLRLLYNECLRQGSINDRNEALVTVEYLNATLTAQVRRSLPAKTAREKLFADLKRARLIDYRADSEVEDADALIAIRGTILQFVADSAINALLAEAQMPAQAAKPSEPDHEA
ncbi:DUF4194 domain-containing protein [Cupriavidus sp. TMH.W2]|uniref:DUF4194 domain-containing protein n=1 Tax=Cupriavidus sp. TMH.W2 TaxID=3434465 RepID=UPI003D78699D